MKNLQQLLEKSQNVPAVELEPFLRQKRKLSDLCRLFWTLIAIEDKNHQIIIRGPRDFEDGHFQDQNYDRCYFLSESKKLYLNLVFDVVRLEQGLRDAYDGLKEGDPTAQQILMDTNHLTQAEEDDIDWVVEKVRGMEFQIMAKFPFKDLTRKTKVISLSQRNEELVKGFFTCESRLRDGHIKVIDIPEVRLNLWSTRLEQLLLSEMLQKVQEQVRKTISSGRVYRAKEKVGGPLEALETFFLDEPYPYTPGFRVPANIDLPDSIILDSVVARYLDEKTGQPFERGSLRTTLHRLRQKN